MPVYNGEKYITEMLEGIRRQTFTDWELVVVDDCSEDGTREIVSAAEEKDSRIRLVCMERNDGVSAARNRGISGASGSICGLWMQTTGRPAASSESVGIPAEEPGEAYGLWAGGRIL